MAALRDRNRPYEVLLAQMPEVAVARIERLTAAVAQVVRVRVAERADGCQRTRLRAAQEDVEVTPPHALAVGPRGRSPPLRPRQGRREQRPDLVLLSACTPGPLCPAS